MAKQVSIDGITYTAEEYEAYLDGQSAFEQGLDESDNPYGSMSDLYLPWENGLNAAREKVENDQAPSFG